MAGQERQLRSCFGGTRNIEGFGGAKDPHGGSVGEPQPAPNVPRAV